MNIRKASLKDLYPLAEVHHKSHNYMRMVINQNTPEKNIKGKSDIRGSVSILQRVLENNHFYKNFTCEDNNLNQKNNLVGFATLRSYNTIHVDGIYYLDYLYVDPDHLGKGVGSSLLEEVEKFALFEKSKKIILYTNKNNKPARQFYENKGYVIRDNKTEGDDIWYEKKIQQKKFSWFSL